MYVIWNFVAPSIFQHIMDIKLQGIPSVVCYFGIILITGAINEVHLANLWEAL